MGSHCTYALMLSFAIVSHCLVLSRIHSLRELALCLLAPVSDFPFMSLAHGHAGDMFSQLIATTAHKSCSWYPALFTHIFDDSRLVQEQWLASKGKNVVTNQLNSWRRQHMSDLTQMFDFAHVNFIVSFY